MVSPDRWNYWVEVQAGGRAWVDLSGRTITRIIFSVLPSNLTWAEFPGALVLPLGLEPGETDSGFDSFPASNLARVPEFSFAINSGYSSPDGLFSTSDILAALEEYNRASGNLFSLIGCHFVFACGDAREVGLWWDGVNWRDLSGPAASSRPVPATAETMRAVFDGNIAAIERSGSDVVNITATRPDEYATTGELVSVDDSDSIAVLSYGTGSILSVSKANNGIIPLGNAVNSVELSLVDSSTGRVWPLDPDSYKVEADQITLLESATQSAAVTLYTGADANGSLLYNTSVIGSNPVIVGFTPAKFQKYTLKLNDASLLEQSAVGAGEIDDYYTGALSTFKASGKNVHTTHVCGRGLDYTPSYNVNGAAHSAFPSSLASDRKYKARISQTLIPGGAYGDSANIDDLSGYEYKTILGNIGGLIPVTNGGGSTGDFTYFLANCGHGTPWSDWNETSGRKTPLILTSKYRDPFSYAFAPNTGRLCLSFPELANVDGDIESCTLEISYRLATWTRYNAFPKLKITTVRDDYGQLQYTQQIAGRWTTDSDKFLNPANAVLDIVTRDYSQPITFFGKCLAKSLAELRIDVDFDAYDMAETSSDPFGNLIVYGARISFSMTKSVNDGDKFLIAGEPTNTGGAVYAVDDLLSKFCPDVVRTGGTPVPCGFSACVTRSEPLRDTLRDILAASGSVLYPSFTMGGGSLVSMALTPSGSLSPSPVSVTDDNLLIDGNMPSADSQTANASEIYNAYLIRFDYDHALGRYGKTLYYDRYGAKTSGFNSAIPDYRFRMEYACQIVGDAKKLRTIDLRFGNEESALRALELYSRFLSWPCRSANVELSTVGLPAISLMSEIELSGDLFPYHMTRIRWIVTGMAEDAAEGIVKLTLLELPDWGT